MMIAEVLTGANRTLVPATLVPPSVRPRTTLLEAFLGMLIPPFCSTLTEATFGRVTMWLVPLMAPSVTTPVRLEVGS